MTHSMRPERLLPAGEHGSSRAQGTPGELRPGWSDLPRQARSAGAPAPTGTTPPGSAAGAPPAPSSPPTSSEPGSAHVATPAPPGPTAQAPGHAALDGRPTQKQAPVTAPPVARPQAGPPPQGRPERYAPGAPPQQTAPPGAEPAAAEDASGSWVLVKACQAGDQEAFKELYSRYQEVVFRYVLFRLGDRTLAEDLTQETFLRALRRIGSVSYQGRDIGAWFVTIARNLIFDHVKSSRYRLESTTADMVEHSPSTHGPEQQVIENATNSELLKAIDRLNPDQQECIRMRFLQGLSVAETAARMNRAEGAVKALQHRAVRRLAQLLPEGLR